MRSLPLLFAVLCAICAPPAAAPQAVVEEVWQLVRERFYDPARVEALEGVARGRCLDPPASDASQTAARIDGMLAALGASHTGRYTPDEPAYYQLLDIYGRGGELTRRLFPDGVHYRGIEIFTQNIGGCAFITGVWHGGPADRVGLLPGDEILEIDGKPFHPIESFQPQTVTMTIRREPGGESMQVKVSPRSIQPREAFARALRDSVRLIERGEARIGYARMWSYAGQMYHDILVDELTEGGLRDADALILDLRGGWGGASPDHAVAFLGATPRLTMFNRECEEVAAFGGGEVDPVDHIWRKPLVVLIDGGSRSGKEVLAHAFRAHGVPMVGERTAGAVVGGSPFLLADDSLLLLAVVGVRVDGEILEGGGVEPTEHVPFDVRYAAGRDPQFDRAIEIALQRLAE